MEADLSRSLRVPIVLLVVEGGPGTYQTVAAAIRQGQTVMVVRESKGCAQTIAEYIEQAELSRGPLFRPRQGPRSSTELANRHLVNET